MASIQSQFRKPLEALVTMRELVPPGGEVDLVLPKEEHFL